MLSVFLVDDEPMVKRGLKKLIDWEFHGFKITGEACNGKEALELITPDNVEIVITDVKMPAMDGIELAAQLKERYPTMKVIMLTGYEDFSLVQQSIRNGVADYILKPVDEDLLIDSLLRAKKQLSEERYAYSFEIESNLIFEIDSFNHDSSVHIIRNLFDEFYKYKVPFKEICNMCGTLLAAIDRYLEQDGYSLNDLTDSNVLSNSYFCNYSSKSDVMDRLISIVSLVIEHKISLGNKKLIVQIKDDIRANFDKNISLNSLASKYFINASYLSQIFKSETGMKYLEYLVKLRMEKAKKLLNDKNYKIQDVCELVGYTDSKYFGQLFKKYYGVLPSEYRQGLTNKRV